MLTRYPSPHTTGACGINEAHSDEDHLPQNHKYNPDPRTARCLSCAGVPHKRGRCLWCSHPRGEHSGNVDPAVKLHLSVPHMYAGHGIIPADERTSTVKWTTSACGMAHCACKQYES